MSRPVDSARRREWIGVLGGTYDPVHIGHLRICRAVRESFGLSRVLLMPCCVPPHKPGVRISSAEHRLEMLRRAAESEPGLEVSRFELDRGGVSYTIDTLRALAGDLTFGGHPLFIMGMDSLVEIPTWRDHHDLVREFDLVAVDRPGGHDAGALVPQVRERLAEVPAGRGAGADLLAAKSRPGGAVYRLTIEPIDISSREIRDRAASGRSFAGLVPPRVARYIQGTGLYRGEETN